MRQGVVIVTPLEGEGEQTTKYNAYLKYLFEPCGLMKFLEEKVSLSLAAVACARLVVQSLISLRHLRCVGSTSTPSPLSAALAQRSTSS